MEKKSKMAKFLRRSWSRYSKLGKRRKKKQKWKKPTGRDNKMREKRRGYPSVVSIGYKKANKIRGGIDGKKPVSIQNIKDLKKVDREMIAILGKVGKKKKIEIVEKAVEAGIKFSNINAKKFLEINKKKEAKSKEVKKDKK